MNFTSKITQLKQLPTMVLLGWYIHVPYGCRQNQSHALINYTILFKNLIL